MAAPGTLADKFARVRLALAARAAMAAAGAQEVQAAAAREGRPLGFAGPLSPRWLTLTTRSIWAVEARPDWEGPMVLRRRRMVMQDSPQTLSNYNSGQDLVILPV